MFLRGNLHDREIDKVADFQDSVGLFSNLTEKDLPIWKNDIKGQYRLAIEDDLETKGTL